MKRLVLLAYQDRSGSTYLAKKISEEFNVFVTKEAEFADGIQYPIPKSIDTELKMIDLLKKSKLRHWEIDWETLAKDDTLLTNPLSSVLNLMDIKEEVVVFKRGRSIFHYEKFKSAFKAVDILVVRRDSEPVWLSQNRNVRSKDKVLMEKSLRNFIRREFLFIQAMNNLLHSGVNLKVINYNDLILDWGGVKKELLDWLGVSYRNVKKSYEIPADQVYLHPLIGNEPDKGRLFAWRSEISLLDRAIIEKCIRGENTVKLTSKKEVLRYHYEICIWKIWRSIKYVRSNFF